MDIRTVDSRHFLTTAALHIDPALDNIDPSSDTFT